MFFSNQGGILELFQLCKVRNINLIGAISNLCSIMESDYYIKA